MGLTRPGGRGPRDGRGARRGGVLRLPGPRGPRPPAAAARRAQGLPRARPAAPRHRPLRRSRAKAGPAAFSRRPPRPRLEGIVAKRADERLRGAALGRVAQDQVPAPPGVRDRRLHRPPGQPGTLRRAAPRPLRGRAARLRVEGRHGLRRRRARAALARARAAPSGDVAVRRGHARGPRASLGRAAARRRGAVHRVDARRRDPPPGLPRAPGRHAPRGMPPRDAPDAGDWPRRRPAPARRRAEARGRRRLVRADDGPRRGVGAGLRASA